MKENEIWRSIIDVLLGDKVLEYRVLSDCCVLVLRNGESKKYLSGKNWKNVLQQTSCYKGLIVKAISDPTGDWSKRFNQMQYEKISESAEIFFWGIHKIIMQRKKKTQRMRLFSWTLFLFLIINFGHLFVVNFHLI